eukprot:GHVP01054047.1.p1 GENE.GHVP01054047.1~~GHVP01054047.1.p1  ORF type:complete len:289 (+),score=67.96 GHVP01054047.1:18-884(+)
MWKEEIGRKKATGLQNGSPDLSPVSLEFISAISLFALKKNLKKEKLCFAVHEMASLLEHSKQCNLIENNNVENSVESSCALSLSTKIVELEYELRIERSSRNKEKQTLENRIAGLQQKIENLQDSSAREMRARNDLRKEIAGYRRGIAATNDKIKALNSESRKVTRISMENSSLNEEVENLREELRRSHAANREKDRLVSRLLCEPRHNKKIELQDWPVTDPCKSALSRSFGSPSIVCRRTTGQPVRSSASSSLIPKQMVGEEVKVNRMSSNEIWNNFRDSPNAGGWM